METKSFERHVEALDDILRRHAAVYPSHDESHEQFLKASEELADELIANLKPEVFRPDPLKLEQARSLADRPIFICGQMKSGTGLMTALIDHHPELSGTPVGAHYLPTESRLNREDFREIAIYWVRKLVNPTGKEPFWYLDRDRRIWDLMFLYFQYFLRETGYDIFVCAALALHSCQERSEPARYWVEKSPQNELDARELQRRFPKAKFLHNIRDPLTNLASLKRLSDVREKTFRARKRAQGLRKLFQAGLENQAAMGPGTYRFVRYEELVHHPQGTMREIASFLGIRFEESLLTPTENGRPATSNSMYKESRVRGRVLDQSENTRYLQDLTPQEIGDIVKELGETAAALGYDWRNVQLKSSRWERFRRALRPEN